MPNLRYRPEIDGLRALAVTGVVLYHIGLGLPGGYVGVDVFFVISGYLITGIIAKDLRAGTFSMLDFWVRRIRRILPAVTVMVVTSLILGYFILEAEQFIALAESSIAQSLMAANIFFWLDNMSYFAEVSDMKPLLHTWSLAVEEQFYVVFPLLLSLLSKHLRKYTLPIIILIGALSLALSCWALMHKPGANFFLLPTRAWELLAGAVIALMANQKEMSRSTAEVAAWLGLLLIASAMFFYNAQTPFPGLSAIPPVAGSAIFIWANGRQQTSAGQLLSFRPIVFIGLISYSFYLWHWPLLVFAKYVIIDISVSDRLNILIASLILSILSWKFVEMPFRSKEFSSKRSAAFWTASLSTACVLLMGGTVMKMHGLPNRGDTDAALVVAKEDIKLKWHSNSSEPDGYSHIGLADPKGKLKVLPSFALWGDSHGMAVAEAIDEIAKTHRLSGIAYLRPGLRPVTGLKGCGWNDERIHNKRITLQSFIDSGVKNIILISRWSSVTDGNSDAELAYGKNISPIGLMEAGGITEEISTERTIHLVAKHLEIMARELQRHGIKIWLIKQVPETNNVHTARDFYMGLKYSKLNSPPTQYTISKNDHQKRQANITQAFSLVPDGLINIIDPTPYFFRDSDRLKVYDERSYYMDDDHLTRAGADYYLSEMFEGIFAELAEQQKDSPEAD